MATPVSGNRPVLTEEMTSHVASFLSPESLATSIQQRIFKPDKEGAPSVFPLSEESMDRLIQEQYQKAFGQINAEELLGKEEMMRCIRRLSPKQPDAEVNHNNLSVPDNFLERWKWIVGVENSLDRQVRQKYKAAISNICQMPTGSILQLKNKMIAFWHADLEVVDYIQFCSEEKARATSGVVNQIFFSCLGFLFNLCYKPVSDLSRLIIGLKERSDNAFATIGGFSLGNQEYDVVACHPLSDLRQAEHRAFHSRTYGKTYVGIFKKEDQHRNLVHFDHYSGNSHNFQVQIAMDAAESNARSRFYYEGSLGHGTVAVQGDKRRLFVGDSIEYRDSLADSQGSDRELDRKLTQIMIEIARQNNVISLQATSNRSDFAVLGASGFSLPVFADNLGSNVLQELDQFRATDGNKLFPPYRDYTAINTAFRMDDLDTENVSYSRDGSRSWSQIIEEEPILREGAAILPDYWAVKPNISGS